MPVDRPSLAAPPARHRGAAARGAVRGLGALVLAALAAAGAGGCGPRAAGGLVVEPTVLDFGTVPVGLVGERTLRVTNRTGRHLLLTEAKSSCVCVEVDGRFQRALSPDESATIHVVLRAKPDGPKGPLEGKRVWIFSDSGAPAPLEVLVHGSIQERVTLAPPTVTITPEDGAGRGRPRRIRLRCAPGFTAQIERSVLSHPDWFTLTEQAGPDGPEVLLAARPDPERRGPVAAKATLRVRTTGEGGPPVTTDLVLSIQGSW